MNLGYFSDFRGENTVLVCGNAKALQWIAERLRDLEEPTAPPFNWSGQNLKLNDRIEITPGTCSGRPHIAKTRIRVQNIVLWTEMGKCPDEIVAEYPQLQLADVHAALLFYFENREEMDRQIREDEHFVEFLQSRPSSSML